MRRRALLTLGAGWSVLVACADLFGFKDLTAADASSDASEEVATCVHVEPPQEPPTGVSAGAAPYTFAFHHIYLTTSPDGGTASYGYDLDGVCTAFDPDAASCIPPSGTPRNDDQPGGVDNASIALLNGVLTSESAVTSTLTDPVLNMAIASGSFTLLGRLFGYGGTDAGINQTVSSGIFFGIQSSPGTFQGVPPAFDGGDMWLVAQDDQQGGTYLQPTPATTFQTTYVSNGVLVATSKSPITIRMIVPSGIISGPLPVRLQQPVLTANIVDHPGGGYDLTSGVLAGRWAAADIMAAVGSLTVLGDAGALCTFADGGYFANVPSRVCPARDISTTGPDNDTQPCDGISVGIGFDAVGAANPTMTAQFPTPTFPCTDAGACP